MKTTDRAGVVGWPISHSRSPLIHRHWLTEHNITGRYDALAVPPNQLSDCLSGLAGKGFRGVNLTIPHKEAALSCLDRLDETARRIGAVNTVVIEENGLVGRNTDAFGFIENLRQQAPQALFGPGRAVILGAGGAARAAVVALAEAGYREIAVANRTKERAETMIANLGDLTARLQTLDWDRRAIGLAETDLLVNATSLGMTGSSPLDIVLDALPDHAVVYDLVYAPLRTVLLQTAQARGLATVDGLGMLIHQARPAFAAWFGALPAATAELRALLINDLQTTEPAA